MQAVVYSKPNRNFSPILSLSLQFTFSSSPPLALAPPTVSPARRTLSRSKHMYTLKEKDALAVNEQVSTSDSTHSTLCFNGNNNNNNKQGLIFNPCTCMSSLGLPPQSVSPSCFLPIIEKMKHSANHKVCAKVIIVVDSFFKSISFCEVGPFYYG